MKKELINDEVLLNYLDGTLDSTSQEKINHLLQVQPDIALRLNELKTIHRFLTEKNKLEKPARNFTDKVMGRLHERQAGFMLSPRHGLMLLGGVLVASGFALALLSAGAFDQLHTILNIQSLPLKTDLFKVPTSLPFDMKLVMKIFLVLNLVLAFILLDRTILRPIFQKRLDKIA